MTIGLVYIGKVMQIQPIPNADKIELLTVVCGRGGKWSGCAQVGQFQEGSACQVYLQDSLLPQTDEFAFMERHKYRVRMVRLRGVPSECLIMPQALPGDVGTDVTDLAGVEKYEKPLPLSVGGDIVGHFPAFIPKTDEPNFQAVPELVNALRGLPWYATVKCDGTSATAYWNEGHLGVCSRNYELKGAPNNALWKIAGQYRLDEQLPLLGNVAVQWEAVGPGIQGNPMSLKQIEPRAFNLWFIDEGRYAGYAEFCAACDRIGMPVVPWTNAGPAFSRNDEDLRRMAEGLYVNGRQREGIVIRPQEEHTVNGERLSFKVLNLLYKE